MRSLEALSYDFDEEESGLEHTEASPNGAHLVLIYSADRDDLLAYGVEEPQEREDEENVSEVTEHEGTTSRLRRQEELNLVLRAQAGDEAARQRLVEANMSLVYKVAKTYKVRSMDYQDVAQTGMIGLIESVDTFDPTRNPKFGAHARYKIKDSILSQLGTFRTINVPIYVIRQWGLLNQVEDELIQSKKSFPSVEELSEASGISANRVEALLGVRKDVVSLNIKLRSGSSLTLQDFIRSGTPAPDEVLEKAEMTQLVNDAVQTLPPREAKIIQGIFGLNVTGEQLTLQALGRELNLTKRRISQLRLEGLKQLEEPLVEFNS